MEQNITELPAPSDYFRDVLSKILKASIENLQCYSLKGDASDRDYFRLKFDSPGNDITSVVLMKTLSPPFRKKIPFVITQAFLEKCRVNVPKLYFKDYGKGFTFLEDLGDITLEEKLNASTPDEQEKYYEKALDILIKMQIECTKHLSKDIPARHLAFDLEKLLWELDFMVIHFIEGFLDKTVSKKGKQTLHKEFAKICSVLSKQKRYFCHRDYHSRNIMITNENNLALIDFQDARMGPCQYDLASLLKDSYFKLSPNLYKKLIKYYIDKKEEYEQVPINREKFIKVFDWMSTQRSLKALGTFGYQINIKKNERYREAIPRTIEYVYDNLSKYDELEGLKRCLRVLYNDRFLE